MSCPSSARTKKDKEARERRKERTLYVTERANVADAGIRRSTRCAGSADGSWGCPCESRTSLRNRRLVKIIYGYSLPISIIMKKTTRGAVEAEKYPLNLI